LFTLLKTDADARMGRYQTIHGAIETPVFMNVGTQAAVKGGLSGADLKEIGCQVQLSNTYHLHLRPGESTVRGQGGIHRFMSWNGPVLTDSGGFQVFSLARLRKISEEGVLFSSHIDGARIFMSPEDSIDIQAALGSDIAMAFDECVGNPAPCEYVKASSERTARWLCRCAARWNENRSRGISPEQDLWGINQGGVIDGIRIEHMKTIAELELPGYAIGGLAVGEEAPVMYHILDAVTALMPRDKPRYLMGVGTPGNIIESVARGIDFFDCVLPARNARHGNMFTWNGRINIKNERYKEDSAPIDPLCRCPVCRNFSRAYLRHLFKAGELLALRLSVMHNLWFYNNLLLEIRREIENGTFAAFRKQYARTLDQPLA